MHGLAAGARAGWEACRPTPGRERIEPGGATAGVCEGCAAATAPGFWGRCGATAGAGGRVVGVMRRCAPPASPAVFAGGGSCLPFGIEGACPPSGIAGELES
eukprot:scaffold6939_cov80-Isochrysis_galbana.AAC.4